MSSSGFLKDLLSDSLELFWHIEKVDFPALRFQKFRPSSSIPITKEDTSLDYKIIFENKFAGNVRDGHTV